MGAALIDAIYTILIAIGMMATIFGPPMYFAIKKFGKEKKEKNYPFRKPAVFTNILGHLVIIPPNEQMQDEVIEYFNDNPEEKQEFLEDVRNPDRREKW